MPNDLRVRTLGNIRNPPNQNEDCGNSAKKTPKRPYADEDRPHANPWKEPQPERPSRYKRQEFPPLAQPGSPPPRHRPQKKLRSKGLALLALNAQAEMAGNEK